MSCSQGKYRDQNGLLPLKNQVPSILETGTGPLVVLVHSSVSGARQWRRLMTSLENRFHLIAINLFGYGGTIKWEEDRMQTLDDQVCLLRNILPDDIESFCIVGHSFGGSVAMKAASLLKDKIFRLVLIEPNPFTLLKDNGKTDAFNEAVELKNCVKQCGAENNWKTAAERFANYWGGKDSWKNMSSERKEAFTESLQPNYFEWDAVLNDKTSLQQWKDNLPNQTLVISAKKTAKPTREIFELMRKNCKNWTFREIEEGGHMAPLTRPDLVNPIIEEFICAN